MPLHVKIYGTVCNLIGLLIRAFEAECDAYLEHRNDSPPHYSFEIEFEMDDK